MSLTEIKQRIGAFLEAVEAAERKLPEYQDRAEKIIEQVDEQRQISERIADLQQQVTPLESELASLKAPYMDALFETNVPRQRDIQKRKKAIEKELGRLDKAIEGERAKLEPIDGLAELHAELDSLSTPNVLTFLRSLDLPLIEEVNAIKGRASRLANTLPYEYDEADYVAARGELDEGYRVLQEELAESERRAERVRQEPQPVGKEMRRYLREEAIAASASDDRVGATVRDSRLSDDLDD